MAGSWTERTPSEASNGSSLRLKLQQLAASRSRPDPKEAFAHSARHLLCAIADAMAASGIDMPACHGEASAEWNPPALAGTRRCSRRYLVRAWNSPLFASELHDCWNHSLNAPGNEACAVSPQEVFWLLMRDKRISVGHLHAENSDNLRFKNIDDHSVHCKASPYRCEHLGEALKTIQAAFRDWMATRAGKPVYPNVHRTLRQIESRFGLSGGELLIYLLGERRFDCAVDLALGNGHADEQAFKLLGWAVDALRPEQVKQKRVRGREVPFQIDDAGATVEPQGATPGLAATTELMQELQKVGASIQEGLLSFKNPCDALVVRTVLAAYAQMDTLADTPDPEEVGVSDLIRAIAVAFRLPEFLDALTGILPDTSGRWRREAVRFALAAALHLGQAGPYVPARWDEKTIKESRKLVESLLGERKPILSFLASERQRADLQQAERRDPGLAAASKELRDIFEESMKRLGEHLERNTGHALRHYSKSDSILRAAVAAAVAADAEEMVQGSSENLVAGAREGRTEVLPRQSLRCGCRDEVES